MKNQLVENIITHENVVRDLLELNKSKFNDYVLYLGVSDYTWLIAHTLPCYPLPLGLNYSLEMVVYQINNLLLGKLDELSILSVCLLKLALPQKCVIDSDDIVDVGSVVISETIDFSWLSSILVEIVFPIFEFWEFKILRSP